MLISQSTKIMSVQTFGHLIILDSELRVVGITGNINEIISDSAESLLRTPVENILRKLFKTSHKKIKHLIESFVEGQPPRALVTAKINNTAHYIKISKINNYIYIEAEPQYRKNISTTDLNEIAFLFESKYSNNWKSVCKAINRIIHFDRVMVLQVQDTGYCKVIAENNIGKAESFLNKQFSKDYLTTELIEHYREAPYRYIADMQAPSQEFYSTEPINLNSTQLISPPETKKNYFNFLGVKTALFFPLYLQGKFWGVVIAHNLTKKFVDLQNRKVCTFIVQNAMSKYETFVKQGQLDINLQIQDFQNHLLKRLAFHKTINCALVESLDNLRMMMQSDGVAIFNEGDVYTNGIDISTNLFFDIIKYLQQHDAPTIFIDHNFRKNRQEYFKEKLPFAGLLTYNVDKSSGYYIVWFRKETVSVETQIEFDEGYPYGIKAWEENIYDTAIPWNDEELSLLEGLQQTLNNSLIQNLLENKNMAKNLSQLNNELEMFTYTLSHDLKNPLSILKMGLQYLENTKQELEETKRKKWFNTLSSGIQNIEDIINNILNLSHDKYNKITKDSIPLKFLIRKIVEETRLLYEGNKCEVIYGNLLPIWGEKSAVYQIFTNVISNAMKYSQQKSHPQISISSRIENDSVCYEITDNGIGIPEDDLGKIYDMFGRGKNTTYYKGSGIGLSLVKRIIERLDGQIQISSTENVGTKVIMYFPIVQNFPKAVLENLSLEQNLKG